MGKRNGKLPEDFDEEEFLLLMEEEGGEDADDYEEDELSLFLNEESDGLGASSRKKAPRREPSEQGTFFAARKRPFTFEDDEDEDEDEDDFDDEDEDEDEVELDRDENLDLLLAEYREKINGLIKELQKIIDSEQGFIDREYDTYGSTERFAQAEDNVSCLESAILDLDMASSELDHAIY